MKNLPLLMLVFVLVACVPPAELSKPTITKLPPTKTPIPTPTLNPAFVTARDNLVAQTNDVVVDPQNGYILIGGQVLKGLILSSDGVFRMLVDGELVDIVGTAVHATDAGITVDGYTQDADGKWGVSESEGIRLVKSDFEDYGYSTEGLEFSENEAGEIVATDLDGREVYEGGKFNLDFAIEQARMQDLMPTNIEPDKTILAGAGVYVVANRTTAFGSYFGPQFKRVRNQFINEYGFDPGITGKATGIRVMLNPDINSWGTLMALDNKDPNADKYLYYELVDGTIYIIPVEER